MADDAAPAKPEAHPETPPPGIGEADGALIATPGARRGLNVLGTESTSSKREPSRERAK